jgi:hypothetical protein
MGWKQTTSDKGSQNFESDFRWQMFIMMMWDIMFQMDQTSIVSYLSKRAFEKNNSQLRSIFVRWGIFNLMRSGQSKTMEKTRMKSMVLVWEPWLTRYSPRCKYYYGKTTYLNRLYIACWHNLRDSVFAISTKSTIICQTVNGYAGSRNLHCYWKCQQPREQGYDMT